MAIVDTSSGTMTRRRFAVVTAGALAWLALGCKASGAQPNGRLRVRITKPSPGAPAHAGSIPLGIGKDRDGLLWIPEKATRPLPLMLLLHGAGGRGAGILRRIEAFAADAGVALLAPDSRGATWDVIRDEFGVDVRFIERALEKTLELVEVDTSRLAIGGFSDGASYALTLGLINGDLFRRIIAFSPGFFVGGEVHGRPDIFISHGSSDEILRFDRTSRLIVPALKKQGYTVTFRQFDGGHEIPPHIAREGMRTATLTGYTIPHGREAPLRPRAIVETALEPDPPRVRPTSGLAG